MAASIRRFKVFFCIISMLTTYLQHDENIIEVKWPLPSPFPTTMVILTIGVAAAAIIVVILIIKKRS